MSKARTTKARTTLSQAIAKAYLLRTFKNWMQHENGGAGLTNAEIARLVKINVNSVKRWRIGVGIKLTAGSRQKLSDFLHSVGALDADGNALDLNTKRLTKAGIQAASTQAARVHPRARGTCRDVRSTGAPDSTAHLQGTLLEASALTGNLLGLLRRVAREEVEAALTAALESGRLVSGEALSNGVMASAVRRALGGILENAEAQKAHHDE